MFAISTEEPRSVASNDFVALDEIQSINFPIRARLQGGLKAYMEKWEITVGKTRIIGQAGVVLLGNIPKPRWTKTRDMFQKLPDVFTSQHCWIGSTIYPRARHSRA